MQTDTIQRIAEYKEIPLLRVVKRLDAEMISRAEQLFVARIRNGERKIAQRPLYTRHAPGRWPHPTSICGHQGRGRRENPPAPAKALAPAAHRSGDKCRRCRSINSPFYATGSRCEFTKMVLRSAVNLQHPIPLGARPESEFLHLLDFHF